MDPYGAVISPICLINTPIGALTIPKKKGYSSSTLPCTATPNRLPRFRASRLCEKGITNIRVCDVSNTHVSELISETFKYSHLVLASVTYNLGIYPVMLDFLEHMKALHVQKRTVAIIENGSWAVNSGDLMQKFMDDNLQDTTILNERVSMASALHEDKQQEMEQLAQALADSLQNQEQS